MSSGSPGVFFENAPSCYPVISHDLFQRQERVAVIARYAGGSSGAKRAARSGAIVVVVDAYRASATIAVLVSKGARVVTLSSVEEARNHPADFRVGERDGAKVEGFDFGNTPTGILASGDLKPHSTCAMTTTNGTRIVEASLGSLAILVGCFVNAGAVAEDVCDRLKSGEASEVVVVGCGWRGRRSSEDEAASAGILSRLEDFGVPLDGRAKRLVSEDEKRPPQSLRNNAAAQRLKRLGYGEDLEFCLREDTVPVVPVLAGGAFVAHSG